MSLFPKYVDEKLERRRCFKEFLIPGDWIFFGEEGNGNFFYVRSIGSKKVYASGDYYYRSSGKKENKRISLEAIADSDALVSKPRRALPQ